MNKKTANHSDQLKKLSFIEQKIQSFNPPASKDRHIKLSTSYIDEVIDSLVVYFTTLTIENFDNHLQLVHNCLEKYNIEVYKGYITQIIACLFVATEDQSNYEKTHKPELEFIADFDLNLSYTFLTVELYYICYHLEFFDVLAQSLEFIYKKFGSPVFLFQELNLDHYHKFVVYLACENTNSLDKKVADYIRNTASIVILALKSQKCLEYNLDSTSNLSKFIQLVINSNSIYLVDQISLIKYQRTEHKPVNQATQTVISNFIISISRMSLEQMISQVGADLVTPEYLENAITSIQDQEKANTLVTSILLEILVPGFSTSDAPKFLASDFQEASIKGQQIRSMLAGSKCDWNKTIESVVASLESQKAASLKPTMISLSQFFFSLPSEEVIDFFLEQKLPLSFNKAIFYLLHEFEAERQSYKFVNLSSVFADASHLPANFLFSSSQSQMRFYNITKLYVNTILSSGGEIEPPMTELFNNDVKQHAECIVFTLLKMEKTETAFELLQNLLQAWLQDMSPYLPFALQRFVESSPGDFMKFLNRCAFSKELKLNELVALLLRLNIFESLLNVTSKTVENFQIWIVYAFKAAHIGWKNFIPVLSLFLESNPQIRNECFTSLLSALLLEAKSEYEYSQSGTFDPNHTSMNLISVSEMLTFIQSYKHKTPVHLLEMKAVQKQCLSTYPRLINIGNGHDEAILANVQASNGSPNTFPVTVEQEMKNHYQGMYSGAIDITEVVRMLQGLKESNVPYQQDVFACMINSLLDEYRFFREYPVDALQKTSILFGSLINYHLIEGITLDLCLNNILDSAKESPESNMFKFAVQALVSAKGRLHEFPHYCTALSEVAGLRLQPQIYEVIELIAKKETQAITEANKQKAEMENNLFSSVKTHVEFLEMFPQEQPSEEVSNKVLFVVNNITAENLQERVGAIKQVLTERNYEWFAEYLVASRAKVELNYQSLYSSVVTEIDSPLLDQYVLYITLTQISRLLNHNSESVNERTYLKNLGNWLGMITLAKDFPILRENIAFKELLIEGLVHDKMTLTIPFTCKVLDQVVSSKVFRPPNPWTMSIIELLVELYKTSNLKLQLTFEIEVLLNALSLKIEDIETTGILSESHQKLLEMVHERTKLKSDILATLQQPAELDTTSALVAQQQQLQAQFKLRQQQMQGQVANINQQFAQQQQQQQLRQQQQQQKQIGVSDLLNAGVQDVNSGLTLLIENFVASLSGKTYSQMRPNVKGLFQLAFSKAIRDVIPAAVDRASNISVNTARTLVLKDFALEADENKLRSAAANLVRGVAQSLGMVFSRDMLLSKVYENVFTALSPNFGGSDPETIKPMILQVINDNLDGACSVIENISIEKAMADMEESLRPALYVRRQHKQENPGQPFVSASFSRWSFAYPPPLGLSHSGVSNEQLQVYEEFGRLSLANQQATSRRIAAAAAEVAQYQQTGAPMFNEDMPQGLPVDGMNVDHSQNLFSRSVIVLQQLLEALLQALKETQNSHLAELPADHPVKSVLAKILAICSESLSPTGDEIYVKVAQFTVNALFTCAESAISYETLVFLLNKLCELSPSTAKDASWWLVYADDDRKYNSKIMSVLLKVGMIVPVDFDASLSKAVASGVETAIKFAAELLDETLLVEEPFCLRTDFAATIDKLSELIAAGKIEDEYILKVMSDLNASAAPVVIASREKISIVAQMGYIFVEWIRLLQHSSLDDRLMYVFVYQLAKKEVLSKAEYMSVFFRTATEISVSSFLENGSPYSRPEDNDVFVGTDALAKLIIKTLVIQADKPQQKLAYLRQILTIITLVLNKDHEMNMETFNERPYYRIFSTLLCEWSDIRMNIEDIEDEEEKEAVIEFDTGFYLLLADFLNILQPVAYPGFSFAWISLLSHRMFLPNIIELPDKEGWKKFCLLLIVALRFTSMNIKGKNIPEINSVILKGLLRIFALIQHDFPDFFVEYHYPLCYSIPGTFVQLKNIVLSSMPKAVTMPDPFTAGLKVEKLEGIGNAPPIALNPGNDLMKSGLKKPVDNYLRIPSHSTLKTIISGLKLAEPIEQGGIGFEVTNVDVKVINALVLYTGMNVIEERRDSMVDFNAKSSHIALLSNILQDESIELQYHILSAMVNQLRYPNAHTHWFSCAIIYFFTSSSLWGSKKSTIQQLITRVLLERLICHRPHPWGVTITFIELLTNFSSEIYELPFANESSELKRLFMVLEKHVSNKKLAN